MVPFFTEYSSALCKKPDERIVECPLALLKHNIVESEAYL